MKGKKYWEQEFYKGISIDNKSNRLLIFIYVMFVCIIISLIFLLSLKNLLDKADTLLLKYDIELTKKSDELTKKDSEIENLKNRIAELEITNNSQEDIKNYILANYKTVPKIVADEIADVLVKKCVEYKIPLAAANAIIEVESAYNPYSVSSKNARGLMQVMYNIWYKKLGLENQFALHDIEIGIDSGLRVLREYLDQTDNDMKKALYKYVGGSEEYGKKVYECMGKYVVFRSFTKFAKHKETVSNGNGNTEEPKIDMIRAQKETDEYKSIEKVNLKSALFTHTIKYQGETISLISKWYTGDFKNWKKIVDANPNLTPEKLMIGQTIIIPLDILINRTPLPKDFIKEQKEKENGNSDETT